MTFASVAASIVRLSSSRDTVLVEQPKNRARSDCRHPRFHLKWRTFKANPPIRLLRPTYASTWRWHRMQSQTTSR